jgi:hypothetical protein
MGERLDVQGRVVWRDALRRASSATHGMPSTAAELLSLAKSLRLGGVGERAAAGRSEPERWRWPAEWGLSGELPPAKRLIPISSTPAHHTPITLTPATTTPIPTTQRLTYPIPTAPMLNTPIGTHPMLTKPKGAMPIANRLGRPPQARSAGSACSDWLGLDGMGTHRASTCRPSDGHRCTGRARRPSQPQPWWRNGPAEQGLATAHARKFSETLTAAGSSKRPCRPLPTTLRPTDV